MSTEHGLIEFINHHDGTVHIDIRDEDGDEYAVSSLEPGDSSRQYTKAGMHWIVRIVFPIPPILDPAGDNAVASRIVVRDASGAVNYTGELGAADEDTEVGVGLWTFEVQFEVTAETGPQTYEISRNGVRRVETIH